jgi:hypothetical protein
VYLVQLLRDPLGLQGILTQTQWLKDLGGGEGWEEVADYVQEWATEHAAMRTSD